MGHITSISINIMNTASVVPPVEKVLTENEGWTKYVKGALATTRERESKIIGGYMPTDFNADEDDLDEQNEGELSYETGQSRDNYSTYDKFGLEDNDDDDEEEGDEEGIVIKGVIEYDEYQEEEGNEVAVATSVAAEVWEEKTIEDAAPSEGAEPSSTTKEVTQEVPKEAHKEAHKETEESQQEDATPESNHVGAQDSKQVEVSV